MRPDAACCLNQGHQRGLAVDGDDRVECPPCWRGAFHRGDGGDVVVMATRGGHLRDVRPSRGGVMTSRRARDRVAMRLARPRTLVEHDR